MNSEIVVRPSLRTVPLLVCLLALASFGSGQVNPVPLVNQPLVPDSVAPGNPDLTLTVNGAGFVSGAVVMWNSNALTTQFLSASQLTATVPASDMISSGTADVTVRNPSGGSSTPAYFTVTDSSSLVAFLRADYANSEGQQAVAVGDFNRDGELDLAITVSSGLAIMLGKGDATFPSPVNYSYGSGQQPFSIAAADFNGDGMLDLAFTLTLRTSTVAVALGNGDGSFQPPFEFPAGNSASILALGDFNGDGRLDVAVTDINSGQVSVLLGNGDGTLQPFVSYGVMTNPESIAVGDFNGDGRLDMAVSCRGSQGLNKGVSVLLGNGDGTFQTAASYSTGKATPNQVIAADLNGDGKLDLAVSTNSGVAVLLGDGDGTFKPAVSYSAGNLPTWIGTADFNGDSKPDLLVTNQLANAVNVLLGNGDGTFEKPAQFGTGTLPVSLGLGDFNGDGRIDFATLGSSANTVSVLLQTLDPVVSLSASSLNFGTQAVQRTSATKTVTLTNIGAKNLNISSVAVTDADFLLSNGCPTSLAPQSQCKIKVSFKPLKKGPLSGQVTINDDAQGSPQTISLSGLGTFALLSMSTLNFGTVSIGQSSGLSVTLTNLATVAMTVHNIYTSGPPYTQTNGCGTSLAAGATCTITATFTPTTNGTKTGTLYVGDSGGGSPQTVSLTGSGH